MNRTINSPEKSIEPLTEAAVVIGKKAIYADYLLAESRKFAKRSRIHTQLGNGNLVEYSRNTKHSRTCTTGTTTERL